MRNYEIFKYLTAKSNCTAYDNELIFEEGKQYYMKELDKELGVIKLISELGDEETFYLDKGRRDYVGDWFVIEGKKDQVKKKEEEMPLLLKDSPFGWLIPLSIYGCLIFGRIFKNDVEFFVGMLGLLVWEVLKWRKKNGGHVF